MDKLSLVRLPHDKLPIFLIIAFFLSGSTSLMYELVWIRILAVVFGKTIVATTIVVSVFMAGLGFGSRYWGKRIDSHKNELKVFSFLQFSIGISSLIIMILFSFLPHLYPFLYGLTGGSLILVTGLIIVISFFFMLVPTFMMGGTLPVISRCFIRDNQKIGNGVGILYTMNTFGAIIGAALTGYLLIGHFGLVQTQLLAILVNLLIGFSIKSITVPPKQEVPEKKEPKPQSSHSPSNLLLIVAGGIGLCGLAYEILCTRALSIFLVNSSYSFSSILVVYLLGISFGSYLFTRFFTRFNHPFLLLALVQIVGALYLIIITAFLNDLPIMLDPLQDTLFKIPLFKVFLPGLILSVILLFIPALGMGLSFPAICQAAIPQVAQIGENLGKIYFVNTLGSICGPLFATFFLIPLIGVVKGILIIALFFILLGIALLIFTESLPKKGLLFSIIVALVFSSSFFVIGGMKNYRLHPPSIFRTKSKKDVMLYYRETLTGTIVAREDRNTGIRTLYVNNNAVCGLTYDALMVVKMLGHLPFIVNSNIQDALIIGFGIGVTTSEVTKHPVKSIECVEIAPGVKNAAHHFSTFNNDIINNPKVRFINGDGRSHLLVSKKKYDLISCDPTHPTLGCGNLYTQEYFELCRDHLTPQGVVSQYLPLHRLSITEFKSIIKTFHTVFPHTTIWLGHSHCILLAGPEKFSADFRYIARFLYNLGDDILNDPFQLVTLLFLDSEAINRFTKDIPVHRDNRPFIEYYTPQSIKKENWHLNAMKLINQRIDPKSYFTNIVHGQKMIRYLDGQKLFLNGLIHKDKGYKSEADVEKVISYFKQASEVNPGNKEIKKFLDNEVKLYSQFKKVKNRVPLNPEK